MIPKIKKGLTFKLTNFSSICGWIVLNAEQKKKQSMQLVLQNKVH